MDLLQEIVQAMAAAFRAVLGASGDRVLGMCGGVSTAGWRVYTGLGPDRYGQEPTIGD